MRREVLSENALSSGSFFEGIFSKSLLGKKLKLVKKEIRMEFSEEFF